jgi:hypothetical protein
LSFPCKIIGRPAVTALVACLTLTFANTVEAQRRPAGAAAEARGRAAAETLEASEQQKPCDKESAYCPTRPCSKDSVLCIDASDKAGDDHEKSYVQIVDPKNDSLRKTIFQNLSNEEQRHEPPKGEFYTFVIVKNQFEDGRIISACAERKTGSFTIANIIIDYKGQKGSPVVSFVPSSNLFIHANSVDVAKGASARGCTFKSASRQTGPYLLYSAPEAGQLEYTLHLKTTAGFIPPASHFAMFAKLATSAAAVWPGFIAISQPAGVLVNTAATDIDQLNAEAGVTSNIEYSAVLTVEKRNEKKDAGLSLQIWSPRLGSKKDTGYMEVSQKRSASIVIDANEQSEWITPDDVLSNPGLGSPHRCIPGTAACDKEQSFAKALNASFVLYGDFKSVPDPNAGRKSDGSDGQPRASTEPTGTQTSGGASRPKNGAENWNAVFETCEKIRSTAADLGLTAIDSQLVRWALLQRAQLIDVLRGYQNGTESGFEKALKAASRVGLNDPYKVCWDAAIDDKRMRAIGAVMGKRFSPAIPQDVAAK